MEKSTTHVHRKGGEFIFLSDNHIELTTAVATNSLLAKGREEHNSHGDVEEFTFLSDNHTLN